MAAPARLATVILDESNPDVPRNDGRFAHRDGIAVIESQ
jgi:hypothetical protein